MKVSTPQEAFTAKPTNDSVDAYEGIQRSSANEWMGRGPFYNTDTNISVKSEYSRTDYNWYRNASMLPNQQEQIIALCMIAYDKVGIVRNVIDLMGDFACQGIDLVHPNKQIEKFYRKWFKKVGGKDRCERFLNILYRAGNVIVSRHDAKLPTVTEEEWRKTYGGNMDVEFEKIQTDKRVIPAKYVFYNPLSVEVVGGELSAFVGKPIFGLRITTALKQMLTQYGQITNSEQITGMYDAIPQELISAVKSGYKYMPLDQDRTSAYYYKKDDWLLWANPMLHAVLNDLMQLEKLQLADRSALDGSISSIRLWKLGILDKENSIFPTRTAITKLRNILAQNVGGGTLDLVWGPELDFKETDSKAYNYLGPDKYQVTLANIYSGLGIPPSLVGGGKDGGFTNNYVAIKTLIERLEYGRDVLKTWLNTEIERVQKAMGFRFPAQIVFDQIIMSDEAAEKALLIQLADRNLISSESLRGKFDLPEEIEKIRIKRDHSEQGNTMPPKAGAFHNPQTDHELNKLAMQRGNVAPSEVGMDLQPRKEGEKSPNEQQHEMQLELADKNNQAKIAQQKYKPPGPNGRPKNAKDSTKRKKKRILPRTKGFIDVHTWASAALKSISEIVVPAILGGLNKKTVRALTNEEFELLETIKFNVLANIEPFTNIDEGLVYNILAGPCLANEDMNENLQDLLVRFVANNERQPTVDEIRQSQVSAYAINFNDIEEEIEDE